MTTSRTIQELQAIPFSQMIGGPLSAVVEAQAQAAQTTIDFIDQFGFETVTDEMSNETTQARTVTFAYEKTSGDGSGTPVRSTVSAPLLSIIPIPYIRVESTDIDFSAKITDILTTDVTTNTGVSSSVGARWSPVRFRANFSYNRSSETTTALKKEYAINVKVRAVQDEMPAGLAKLLTMMENAIHEVQEA